MKTFSTALKDNISRHGFKKAMKQTWVEVRAGEVARPPQRKKKVMTVQEKRYAARMSHGGGYPLGYKGRNPKRSKNPLPIGFGARLKELIAEGLPAKEAMKEAWREVKKSRTKTGAYSGSREIFGRKRRKNPRLKRGTYLDLSEASKSDLEYALNVASILASNGFEKRANQIRKMVKNRKGVISVDASSALDSPAYKKVNPKRRKNPIAIYNPPNQKLLYGRAYIPVIRGIKTSGKYKGERYQHNFSKSNEVSIYGNSDGSITVKSNNNIRLWDYDKDI